MPYVRPALAPSSRWPCSARVVASATDAPCEKPIVWVRDRNGWPSAGAASRAAASMSTDALVSVATSIQGWARVLPPSPR